LYSESRIPTLTLIFFPLVWNITFAGVAQLVEQETLNLLVVGSSPSAGTIFLSNLHFHKGLEILSFIIIY
jgi:hypothetical protein